MHSNPKLAVDQLCVGNSRQQVVVENLSRTQIVQYAGAAGDFQPVHHDEALARQYGLPSIFAHGMLTMGLVGKAVTDWLGDNVLRRYSMRFVSVVWPGDTLTVVAKITAVERSISEGVVSLDLTTHNQKGEIVTRGGAVACLPLSFEKG